MRKLTEQQLIRAFTGKKVLVVGDIMLDEYVWGKVRRISPEAPVPVVEFERRTHLPGGAANVAANVLSLAGQVLLASVVGADPQGTELLALLQKAGADVHGIARAEERWTTTKTRLLAHSQQVVRMDYERAEPISTKREDDLLAWADEQLDQVEVCVLSDYAKGLVSVRVSEEFIRLARHKKRPVVVDPKGTNFAKYRGASLVKPNLLEVERFLNHEIQTEEALLDAGRRLLEVLDGAAVLITRGAYGMSLFRADNPPFQIPSLARNVFDVTGAGDTVIGTLALALAAGATLEVAASLANRAAGIVVGKVGTAQVMQEELLGHVGSE